MSKNIYEFTTNPADKESDFFSLGDKMVILKMPNFVGGCSLEKGMELTVEYIDRDGDILIGSDRFANLAYCYSGMVVQKLSKSEPKL